MIALALIATLYQGVSVTCYTRDGCQASLTITATIVASQSLAMETTDLGIIGIDAYRVVIHYQSSGDPAATNTTDEYLVMRRPGSTDETPMIATAEFPRGNLIWNGNPEEMLATKWEEAKPILLALRKGRHMLAWKRANRLSYN